jgi:hypothetical protein
MALQKNIIIPSGEDLSTIYTEFMHCTKSQDESLTNGYIKIENLNGDKDGINIRVGFKKDKNSQAIFYRNFSFVPSENNFNYLQQGYEYLKTLDEFKDAIDLLDEGQTA